MKRWLIEQLGGFPDVDSALAHIKAENDTVRKHQVLTEAVKHLFNAIGPEDILHRDEQGRMLLQGKPLTNADEAQLVEDVHTLLGMRLWRALKMDIRYQLNKKMFEESNITADVMWGKLLLFLDDVIRTRLQHLAGKK